MGYLEQVLAQIDNAKRVAGRNISDLAADPAQYAEKIVGHLRNRNANVVPTASPTELTNRPMTQDEIVKKYVDAGMDTLSGGLGVIKPKGGNWLSGQYGPEAQLKQLKKPTEPYVHRNAEGWAVAPEYGVPMPEVEAAALRADPVFAQNQALNNWIDQKLTKYIKNDMASPADPIRLMLDKFPEEKAAKLAQAEAKVQALRQKQAAQAATRGVPEEMLTRTRQDVLAAEEARDLIEANTGLHYSVIPYLAGRGSPTVQARRERTGFPDAFAKTELGQQWENTADSILGVNQVKDFQRYPNNLRQDPWLAKADPSAPVYNFSDNGYETGFAHLTDELANSLREGRLTPEQLGKMPIDQAVKHVAEINALRAVEANKARAMDIADIPIYKEYPESGMSWRQLKQIGDQDAWQQQFDKRKAELTSGHTKWARDSLYKKIESELGPSPYQKLEKWLKQEGDAMGHCVGGYCDDVASGQSNIYSLRDAKGKPYVTIETEPNLIDMGDYSGNYLEGTMNQADALAEIDRISKDPTIRLGNLDHWKQDIISRGLGLPIIRQVKGKNNDIPPLTAMPYIQDFIKSGKWGQIHDRGYTGMSNEEIDAILKGQQ